MAIVTRAGKGSALTHTEMDANLNEINLKANLASPAFTATPTAPTAPAGTNTTQLATTQFVLANSDMVPNAQTYGTRTRFGGGADNGVDALQVNGNISASNVPNYNNVLLGGGSELYQKSVFINLHPGSLYMFKIWFSGGYVINTSFTVSTANRIYGATITNFKNGTYLGDSTYITVKNHLGQDHTSCTSEAGLYNNVNYVAGIEITFNNNTSGNYLMTCVEIVKGSYTGDQNMITTSNAPATVVRTFNF
jgi:hypothetical protein